MDNNFARIKNDSRVAIIGGGPAGSFFALYLMHYAEERGIHPQITIYQQRNFDDLGPKGCKGCAGILSMSLLRNLSELSLAIPEEVIRSKIDYYTVHSPYTSISISNPENDIQIVSVYRGGGPRISHYEAQISLDGWLLRQTQSRGVKVENQRVSQIFLGEEVGIEIEDKKLEYDLLVLASGINTKTPPIAGLKYLPSKTQTMAQDELFAGIDQVKSRLGNSAHAFLIPHSGLIFGTLVPKGPFINVSVLSSGEHPVSVDEFLSHDIVRKILPDHYERVCGCRPRALVTSARNYYADRFVAIGDAAITRLYKDGVGSSLLAAREAARTVVHHGASKQDFKHYYQPFCRSMGRNNRWGRLLFFINNKVKDSRTFLLTQHRVIGDEQGNTSGQRPFTKAAWGMFSGGYSYDNIARMVFGPISLAKFSMAFLKEALSGPVHRGKIDHKKLYVGAKKVLILGSGFGGTYTLRNLVPFLNRNDNVETTMVSDENFFLFAPLLHEVAMGSIEKSHIAYPIRRLHWRDRFNFVQAKVENIDLSNRTVTTTLGTLDFDYLVLALGSITNTSELVSTGPSVFTLKTLLDSMLIRHHIIGLLEQASMERDREKQRQLLTFVVSGGGYTGVQLVTALRDFVYGTITRFYNKISPDNIRIILVEAKPKIVGRLDTKLGAYIMKHLRQMGIEVILKSRVTSVREGRVEINGKEDVPAGTIIWVAGVVANPRIAELDVEKDPIGRVLVNEYMEVKGFSGVYAVGDCAHFEDPVSGYPIPPLAHTAVRQARVVAHNILAEIRGRDKKAYHYSHNAEAVSLGASKAVFRYRGIRLYGLPAHFLWIIGYSLLVTGTYNRIRITMDWFLSGIFGRDTTFLKLRR